MTLTLTITNVDTLDNGVSTRLRLDRHGAVIGRSAQADWSLPDPQHFISSTHCEIDYRDGAYVLVDKSTNGSFLNGSQSRLAGTHVLADGDEILIGHYKVRAKVEGGGPGAASAAAAAGAGAAPAWGGWDSHAGSAAQAPVQDRGWDAPEPVAAISGAGPMSGHWSPPTASTPVPSPGASVWAEATAPVAQSSDWSSPVSAPPADPSAADVWGKLAEGNSVDWSRGGFGQPPASVSLTSAPPKDPFGLSDGAADNAMGFGAAPAPRAAAATDDWGAPASPASPPAAQSWAPAGAQSAQSWGPATAAPASAPSAQSWGPATAAPAAAPPAQPWGAATAPPPPRVEQASPPAPRAAPAPAPATAPRAAPASPAGAPPDGALAALLAGAGLAAGDIKADPQAALTAAGDVLRRLVAGMVVMMEARARAKAQLGAQSTSLEFDGNNPLKFARSPEGALAQLINPPERGFMPADRAVEDAFRDLQAHQMATLIAMQGALGATLARFSPAAIRERAEMRGVLAKIIPAARDAEMWKAYEREFEGVARGSDEAFMDVFAKEFKNAYEKTAADMKARR
jgi:type VI secretion system protein